MHLAITDSGLGGLSICADVERNLRRRHARDAVRITYVNAWPDEGTGYNDLPDAAARAAVFDRALRAIASLRPDRVLIACNTLSILYPLTEFSRTSDLPVHGIIDTGVDLFHEAMTDDPARILVVVGTKTTIEADVHRHRLIDRGVDSSRLAGQSCHGLAAAIESDPEGARTASLIESCAAGAASHVPAGRSAFLGLCCTHYTYVAERLRAAMARQTGGDVRVLDPNRRLAERAVPAFDGEALAVEGTVTVSVVSKVPLTAHTRASLARLVAETSPATAEALVSYVRIPDLF